MREPSIRMFAAAVCLAAGAAGAEETGATMQVRPSAFVPSKKSPVVGTVLAVVPGVLVHGTGHHYAGRSGKAVLLHAVEGAGIALIAVGASRGKRLFDDFSSDDKIPGDIAGVTRWEGMVLGGTILFLSSWLYDIFGTPKAVSMHNARVEAAQEAATTRTEPVGEPQAAAGRHHEGGKP